MALARHLSQSQVLIEWATHEDDNRLKHDGIRELESYRTAFLNQTYFFVIDKSGDYYFNNNENAFAEHQFRYALKPDAPKDAWYYATKQVAEQCQVNVNHDAELMTTKVWINCLVKQGDKIVGIVGTGLDLTGFVQTVVNANQKGVINFTINKDGAIQASPHIDMIDYASLTHAATGEKNIFSMLEHEDDRLRFKQLLNQAQNNIDPVGSIFADINGDRRIISVANMNDIGWFNVTVINLKELALDKYFLPFGILLGVVLLTLIFLTAFLLHRLVLSRLQHLDENVALIKSGEDLLIMQSDVPDELGRLNNNFVDMAATIRQYSSGLEKEVAERVRELEINILNLEASEEKFKKAFYLNPDAINITRVEDGVFVSINQGFTRMMGYSEGEAMGRTSLELNLWNNPADRVRMLKRLKKYGVVTEFEARFRARDGRVGYGLMSASMIEIDGAAHILTITRDITERKQTEQTIHHLAYFDSLTQLPNRQLFLDRLKQLTAQARRNKVGFSLFYLDLDEFKLVNDTAGHEAGDRALEIVAARLIACVREGDTVARIGGDEFTLILPGIVDRRNAVFVAEKVVASLGEVLSVNGKEFTLGASIGIAMCPVDGCDVDALLRCADDAMYAAKKIGKNCYKFHA
ncbi:MAG: hypothetical protein COS35_04830 [Zetaproteobacteria bacterium CG02_land_8_20_14_3_00_50_9]|nr:MAG: hypothetical protein AUJ57_02370 [Zetaproteobacteria bacterium CG1_02_53_45]PIQ32378.1 MAG: hypothetical protein COW62_07765 [Zetaproteobacteria bacterium CG17_big_fil_post_rev_8_21_14_2_50_50_13]PIV30799.1 MAG: hypothetical protein COS35_04830 [Zetaproteobacteria bacterium CG02_land_8_20_14_3_00_50_9]PIY54689.1 MAG: hypothetical protein COZ00_13435 [Zetaproteobacteria bacterium CG_4_10_14_0_8_um_filter_49_80]